MAFGIGINTEKPDEGEVRGTQQAVACDCWFTSKGKIMPRWLKYEDEEGIIRVLKDISVLSHDKKRYCGIPMIEYKCSVEIDGRDYLFQLLFNQEDCTWKIVWRG